MYLLEQRQKVIMREDKIILCVVHRIKYLLRRHTNVDRVQHGPNHRHREKTLKIAMTVPIKHRHGVPRLNPCGSQHVGHLPNTLVKCAIAVAKPVSVHNLLLCFITLP
ncbi:hypothetical protein D3C84_914600 [compost metagenome]